MSGIFSVSKYLPRASPHHVEPRDSERGDDAGLDVILVYGDARESEEEWPAKFRAITKSSVRNFRVRPKSSNVEKDAQRSLKEGADASTDTKPEGGHDKSSTRSLVFVVEPPDARAILFELLKAEPRILDDAGGWIATAGRTYGVIELRQHQCDWKYLSDFKFTCLLAWGHWGFYSLARNYDACRQLSAACASLRGPRIMTNPSTGVAVFATLAYMGNIFMQYDMNRGDYYQQLCLVTGLVVGFLLSPSVASTVRGPPVSLHTLIAMTSVAMACSAFGHLVWRKYFSTREGRLEQKLTEWKDEARRTATGPYVVKFHKLA